jgi:UDP-N-acetylglucosamine/UDP-N-acetyl-alpha-D-glucosaminouronate 4-epimerase
MNGINTNIQKFYTQKKVLVTGGAGFIGSHITHTLVAMGAQVTVLDDFSTGFSSNLEDIKDQITIIHKSITNLDNCIEASKNCEIIFHLAAFISVPKSVEDPYLCYTINVNGTLNLLEAARINSVSHLIFSSSSAIYGDQELPYHEDMAPKPQSPYGASKLIGEKLCQDYATTFGINTISLRYFNVYGDRQNPHAAYAAVVAKFKDQMKTNKPITIYGDGKQTRDFVSVNEVVMANLMSPMLDSTHLNGQPINIASGKSIDLFDLITMLKPNYPEWQEQVLFAPARAGDVLHTVADVTKYHQLLQ